MGDERAAAAHVLPLLFRGKRRWKPNIGLHPDAAGCQRGEERDGAPVVVVAVAGDGGHAAGSVGEKAQPGGRWRGAVGGAAPGGEEGVQAGRLGVGWGCEAGQEDGGEGEVCAVNWSQ